jgi:hypothetical protein
VLRDVNARNIPQNNKPARSQVGHGESSPGALPTNPGAAPSRLFDASVLNGARTCRGMFHREQWLTLTHSNGDLDQDRLDEAAQDARGRAAA